MELQRRQWTAAIASFLTSLQSPAVPVVARGHKMMVSDHPLVDYLKHTINEVDQDWTLSLTDHHRRPILRALLDDRPSKAEFDAHLRSLAARLQWNATERFMREYVLDMHPPPDAPQFADVVGIYESYCDRPSKLFSHIAMGRTYQGKFDQLLEAVRPDLLPIYKDTVFKDLSDLELLRCFVAEQPAEQRNMLLQCVETPFPAAPSQPSDGGKSSGQRSEMDLSTFLLTKDKCCSGSRQRILAPVHLQTFRNGRDYNKKSPFIIEVEMDFHGKTSEFDAVIVEIDDNRTATILQVWEAKECLHPMSLDDILTKKYQTLNAIIQQEATLIINGERFIINGSSAPKLGIYGETLMKPRAAARRTQIMVGAQFLETMACVRDVLVDAVKEGKLSIPDGAIAFQLERLLHLVQEIQPLVVVSGEELHI
jgi:hypothetical protein